MLKDSKVKSLSDDILQFVCAHRAETFETRRKPVNAKDEALTVALHRIPPSATHLFDEKLMANFIKDNGGMAQVFSWRQGKFPDRKPTFRKPTATGTTSGGKNSNWQSRPKKRTRADNQNMPPRGNSSHVPSKTRRDAFKKKGRSEKPHHTKKF